MISSAIHTAFLRAVKEKWWKIYVAIDIHGAIFPSTDKKDIQRVFFPGAKEALQYLSNREDVDLMLFTCSKREEIKEVLLTLARNNIYINYINKNFEVKNDARGDYRFKPYYNILIDDKAGFEPNEWEDVLETFKVYPVLKRRDK